MWVGPPHIQIWMTALALAFTRAGCVAGASAPRPVRLESSIPAAPTRPRRNASRREKRLPSGPRILRTSREDGVRPEEAGLCSMSLPFRSVTFELLTNYILPHLGGFPV